MHEPRPSPFNPGDRKLNEVVIIHPQVPNATPVPLEMQKLERSLISVALHNSEPLHLLENEHFRVS